MTAKWLLIYIISANCSIAKYLWIRDFRLIKIVALMDDSVCIVTEMWTVCWLFWWNGRKFGDFSVWLQSYKEAHGFRHTELIWNMALPRGLPAEGYLQRRREGKKNENNAVFKKKFIRRKIHRAPGMEHQSSNYLGFNNVGGSILPSVIGFSLSLPALCMVMHINIKPSQLCMSL